MFHAIMLFPDSDAILIVLWKTWLLDDEHKQVTDSHVKMPETGKGPRGKDIVLLMASDKRGNQGHPIAICAKE